MQKISRVAVVIVMMVTLVLVALLASCAQGVAPKPASTPTAGGAVSFGGKTISIVVGTTAGGAADVVARVYVRYMPKFLPGYPAMIVRNMPGGGYTIAANYVYASKPDGLTILANVSGASMAQLLGASAVHFDLLKMTTVMGTPSGGLFYIKSGIIPKAEDLLKAQGLIFGYTGGPGPGGVLFAIAKESLGFPVDKVALAYSGVGDSRRAFLSGEINFSYESSAAYQEAVAPYVDKGAIMLLFQSGLLDTKGDIIKDPALPPIPTFKELYEKIAGKPLSGILWDAYRAAVAIQDVYSRCLLLPPGTPDSVVQAYWNAAEAMFKDPQFLATIEPMVGKGSELGAGPDYDKMFKQSFAIQPEVRDWIVAALRKYSVVVE